MVSASSKDVQVVIACETRTAVVRSGYAKGTTVLFRTTQEGSVIVIGSTVGAGVVIDRNSLTYRDAKDFVTVSCSTNKEHGVLCCSVTKEARIGNTVDG